MRSIEEIQEALTNYREIAEVMSDEREIYSYEQ